MRIARATRARDANRRRSPRAAAAFGSRATLSQARRDGVDERKCKVTLESSSVVPHSCIPRFATMRELDDRTNVLLDDE